LGQESPPLSLGAFLAVRSALQSNGDEMQKLYSILLSMKSSIPAFWGIFQFLNVPTDLQNRREAAAATSKSHDDFISNNIHFDYFPLLLDDVTFGFEEDAPLVKHLHLEIGQGTLIQVSGPPGTGKKSLLELLSQVHIPTAGDGSVFVPEHLKVLNVCSETQILDGTLAYNLFFGVLVDRAHQADRGIEDAEALLASIPEKDIERGKRICARLGLRQNMIDRMFVLGSGELATLSRTTRHLIHLARALIYNPGVLVVHTPLAWFDEELGHNITGALKEFVQRRGLELDSETSNSTCSSGLSARTCIFSTCLQEDLIEADVKLSLKDGQLVLSAQELCPDNDLAESTVSGVPSRCPTSDVASATTSRASSQEVRVITCPAGHRLVALGLSESNGWGCDGRNMPGGCKAGTTGYYQCDHLKKFRCNECDFDLCEPCYSFQQERSSTAPAASAAGFPPAGPALLAGGGARGPCAARLTGAASGGAVAETAADAARALDAVV